MKKKTRRTVTHTLPTKTMKVQNHSAQGLEILFEVGGQWEHFWLEPSQILEIPDAPMSQTASELVRRQVISVHRL